MKINFLKAIYPALLEPNGKGWMISFPDVPEALTGASTKKEALKLAPNALVTAMEFYLERGRDIPEPSLLKLGQVPIEVRLFFSKLEVINDN